MGASKNLYMEMVTVEIERKQFELLCIENDFCYSIKKIEAPDYPYHENEKWKEQKQIADKEYKKLKAIEYEIRNK